MGEGRGEGYDGSVNTPVQNASFTYDHDWTTATLLASKPTFHPGGRLRSAHRRAVATSTIIICLGVSICGPEATRVYDMWKPP